MIPGYLSDEVKIDVVAAAAAAAQTDVASDILDMEGFDSVMFLALMGDVTSGSVLELAVQQNSVNSTSGMAEINSSGVFTAGAADADSKLLKADTKRVKEQFVRAVLSRGTQNAVVGGIIAIRYNARNIPTTDGATVIAAGTAVSPAEA